MPNAQPPEADFLLLAFLWTTVMYFWYFCHLSSTFFRKLSRSSQNAAARECILGFACAKYLT